jgi:hypothetical protein
MNMYFAGGLVFDADGIARYSGVDIDGKPVERSRGEFPYSYDGYVTYRNGSNDDIDSDVYTDRIWQWDYDKAQSIWKKHTEGMRISQHDLSSPNSKVWEAFLRDYFDLPNLKIIVMMDCCNWSSGYEVGRIAYNKGE